MGRAITREKDGKQIPFASFNACWTYVRFIREKVTPLLGPFPDLLRSLRTERETRTLWASAMSKGQTLDEAMASCASQQSALWLWTTESDNRNVPDVPSLAQDGPPAASTWFGRSRSRGRTSRGSDRGRAHSHGREARRPEADRAQNFSYTPGIPATTTAKGLRICSTYNKFPNGCSDKCINGELHICDYVNQEGRLCGQSGKRRCTHHPDSAALVPYRPNGGGDQGRGDRRGGGGTNTPRPKGKGIGRGGNRR